MYTVKQLRKLKYPTVKIHTQEQAQKLRDCGFDVCCNSNGTPYSFTDRRYCIKAGTYLMNSSPRDDEQYDYVDFNEIDFEENNHNIPLINN